MWFISHLNHDLTASCYFVLISLGSFFSSCNALNIVILQIKGKNSQIKYSQYEDVYEAIFILNVYMYVNTCHVHILINIY